MCGDVCAWPTSLRTLRQRVAEGSCRIARKQLQGTKHFRIKADQLFAHRLSKMLQAGDGQSRQLLRVFDACRRQIAEPLADNRLEVIGILSLTSTVSCKFGKGGIKSLLQQSHVVWLVSAVRRIE